MAAGRRRLNGPAGAHLPTRDLGPIDAPTTRVGDTGSVVLHLASTSTRSQPPSIRLLRLASPLVLAGSLLFAPATAAGETCPLDGDLAEAPRLDPSSIADILRRLRGVEPAACAQSMRRVLIDENSPPLAAGLLDVTSSWPADVAEPWLVDVWGGAWLNAQGRREDALQVVAAALETRLGERDPFDLMRETDAGARWTRYAWDRYAQEWEAGLTREPPPFDDAFEAEAHRRWLSCLDHPETSPADPFDPLGLKGEVAGRLGVAARCASQAVVRAWSESDDEEWAEIVRSMLWNYSSSHSTLTELVVKLESGWGQGQRPGGGHPLEVPMDPRPPDVIRRVVLGWCALFLVALAVSAPKRSRRLGFPLLAIAFGLGLVGLAELGLRASGVQSDGSERGGVPLELTGLPDHGAGQWLHDQRARPFQPQKPEGVARIGVVGASTIAGPGLSSADSIPGRLRSMLVADVPCVEVLNLGRHGADSAMLRSWTLRAVEELGLDGVLLYSGHNEVASTRETRRYLELNAVESRRRTTLDRLALWTVLQDRLIEPEPLAELDEAQIAQGAQNSRHEYRRYNPAFDDTVTARAEREFRDLASGLGRMDTPLVIALPSFNHHGLRVSRPAGQGQAFELQQVENSLLRGEAEAAAARVDELMAHDDGQPMVWSLLSLTRELVGDLEGAEEAIWGSARRNHLGSAVTPGVIGALRLAAAEHGVLADAHAALHVAAGDHLPGYDLFVDYVHLNPRGADIVAGVLLDAARDAGYVDDWAARCTPSTEVDR